LNQFRKYTSKQNSSIEQPNEPPKNNGQYKVLTLIETYRPSKTADCFFTTRHTGSRLIIEGVVCQEETVIELIKCNKTIGNQCSKVTANAWGCLVLSSRIHDVHQAQNNIKFNLYVPSRQSFRALLQHSKSPLGPSTCYTPEWELYNQAYRLATSCHTTFKVMSEGQDDQLEDWLLSPPEAPPTARTKTQLIPAIDKTYILVNRRRITTDYQSRIRHQATTINADQYMQEKYTWNDSTFNNICWEAHGQALQHLRGRRQKTIIQFIHQWLPCNAAASRSLAGTARLCPYCTCCKEDQAHFLECKHDDIKKSWQSAATTFQSRMQHYNKTIHHHIIRLLTTSLTEWRTTIKPELPTYLHPSLHQLFHKQSEIGWNHVIQGRLSTSWTKIPNQTAIDIKWITYTITQLRNAIHEVWSSRSRRNHGNDAQSSRERVILRLQPQVTQLFTARESLPYDAQYIFLPTIEDTMKLPTPSLENWVFKAKMRIQNLQRITRKKNKSNAPIHPFFTGQQPLHKYLPTPKTRTTSKPKRQKVTQSILTYFQITTKNSQYIHKKRPKDDLFPP
jgi:hypothetical protein